MNGVRAVLFDIDDTLIDLASAQQATFRETIAQQAQLAGASPIVSEKVSAKELDEAAHHFASDAHGFYQRYIHGEMSFAEQRLRRAAAAMDLLHMPGHPARELWTDDYERRVRARWSLFSDVLPLLHTLDAHQIPYGAVSNNVAEYQRGKLSQVGLSWDLVIGTDTTGHPKPASEPFVAACDQLNMNPTEVAMVGDNPIADGQGALDAGLVSVVIDRSESPRTQDMQGAEMTSQDSCAEGHKKHSEPPNFQGLRGENEDVQRIKTLAEVSRFVFGS